MKKTEDEYKYNVYQRDWEKLILIDEYTIEEIEEYRESMKNQYYLQYFKWDFIIFKWKTPKTID